MTLLNASVEAQSFKRGDHIDHVAGADIAPGTVLNPGGGLVGINTDEIKSGEQGAVQVEGVILVRKASATVFAEGASVGWDNTAKLAVALGDFKLGYAVIGDFGGGADGDDFVAVKLVQQSPS